MEHMCHGNMHDSEGHCEYCGEMDHAVADCADLAAYRDYQDLQDMAAEAAYYQVPKGALEK